MRNFLLAAMLFFVSSCFGQSHILTHPYGGTDVAGCSTTGDVLTWDGTNWHCAAGGTGTVYCEYVYPLQDCNAPLAGGVPTNDIIRNLLVQPGSYPFIGPLPYTHPLSLLVQDLICTDATQIATITCTFGGVISPGNALYVVGDTADGIGYLDTITFSDSLGNSFIALDSSNNPGIPSANAWAPITVGGVDTITMTVSNPQSGANNTTQVHIMELRNISAVDVHTNIGGGGGGPLFTFPSITTTNANDVIVGTMIGTGPYTAGSGFSIVNQVATTNGGVHDGLATETKDVQATGTYAPTITSIGSPTSWIQYNVAFVYSGSTTSGTPTFRKTIVQDQVTQGWFPDPTGNSGRFVTTPDGVNLSFSPTPAVFSAYAACTGSNEGAQISVSDSTTVVWGATVTGGGANHVLAYCNSTNWTVIGK